MRKVFWGGAALAVVAAAGLYLAADHASRHHDSFLGRFMIGAYESALYTNPVFFLSQGFAGPTCAAATNAPAANCSEDHVTGCASVEIRTPRHSSNPDDAAPLEVVDLTTCRLPGRIAINEEEELPIPTFHPRPEEVELTGAAVELIPPPALDENQLRYLNIFEAFGAAEEREVPAIMPTAEDNPAPATMPYADEDEAPANGFLKFWKMYLRKMTGGDCCRDKDEESDLPRHREPPDPREDLHHHQQYPGCPYYHCPQSRNYCPYSGHSVIPAIESKPRQEMQVYNGHVLDQTVWNAHFETGADKLTPGGLEHLAYLAGRRPCPDPVVYLQTAQDIPYDPAAPDKYVAARNDLNNRRMVAVQKCLSVHTAGRPVAFAVVVHDPAETVPAVPIPEPEARRGRNPWSEGAECQLCPRHWGVDTMEFRPTDAKPEEFGLVPF